MLDSIPIQGRIVLGFMLISVLFVNAGATKKAVDYGRTSTNWARAAIALALIWALPFIGTLLSSYFIKNPE